MLKISISTVIISMCFLVAISLILTDTINRAVVTISAALVVYFTLTFVNDYSFFQFVDMLFGTESDGFVNLHALILILGMMFIVEVSAEAGVFEFLAVLAIKMSNGKPIPLLSIFCVLAVVFSALLNNILTVMILIPLTITISRILNIDPSPYILTQAVLVNIGGTVFSISSIPNILIVTAAGIEFTEYFISVGLYSIFIVGCSILYFLFLYKPVLKIPRDELIDSLENFEIWNVVQSKIFLFEATGAFVILIAAFFFIPTDVIPSDIIAITIAMGLTILSSFHGIETQNIIKKFDLELLLYLLGVFILAAGLEEVGVIDVIGHLLQSIGGGELVQILLILWFGAIFSSLIDNIPITKVLIPIIGNVSASATVNKKIFYYSLSVGANWGDNLTPLGDNILVMNIAKQQKRPISMKRFWKLGLSTTVYQLLISTIYFSFLIDITIGIMLLGVALGLFGLLLILRYLTPQPFQNIMKLRINAFRRLIIS